ncbi:MAG TPA: DUF4082 domain-containing protein [Nevskiaceae bacterium]|nr:DUF4082 domain-containing protein [Nevskiaceae bacterium]
MKKYKIRQAITAVMALGLTAAIPLGTAGAVSSCPFDLMGSLTPYETNFNDSGPVNIGVKFNVRTAPSVSGVKFYKGVDNTGTHTAYLRDITASSTLASQTFSSETSSGWQEVNFSSSVAVDPTHDYMVWVSMPNGHYAVDTGSNGTHSFVFEGMGNSEDVSYIGSGSSSVYTYSSTASDVPSNTSNSNYWVTPVVDDATNPSANSSMSGTDETEGPNLSWTRGYDTNSATSSANPIKNTVSRNGNEEGTTIVGVQAGGGSSFVDPTARPGINYTYITQNKDACGRNSSTASTQVATASETLENIFTTNPSTVDTGQTDPVTVGMRWNTTSAGDVWGVRFYRSGAYVPTSGQFKVGLWDNNGDLLASREVPFGYNGLGWTDVRFEEPVSVSANHDYVVGYYSPNGREVYTQHGLDSQAHHMGNTLYAPADDTGTPNGVYSTSSTFSFPSSRSATADWYGVDVNFLP